MYISSYLCKRTTLANLQYSVDCTTIQSSRMRTLIYYIVQFCHLSVSSVTCAVFASIELWMVAALSQCVIKVPNRNIAKGMKSG